MSSQQKPQQTQHGKQYKYNISQHLRQKNNKTNKQKPTWFLDIHSIFPQKTVCFPMFQNHPPITTPILVWHHQVVKNTGGTCGPVLQVTYASRCQPGRMTTASSGLADAEWGIFPMVNSLRIQVCPEKGIICTILFWGCDLDHQSYSIGRGLDS